MHDRITYLSKSLKGPSSTVGAIQANPLLLSNPKNGLAVSASAFSFVCSISSLNFTRFNSSMTGMGHLIRSLCNFLASNGFDDLYTKLLIPKLVVDVDRP